MLSRMETKGTRQYKKSGWNPYGDSYYTPSDEKEIASSTNPFVVLLRNTIPDADEIPVVVITYTEREKEENCFVTISLQHRYAAGKSEEQLKEWRAMIHNIIAE
jgi:hypothetical protein